MTNDTYNTTTITASAYNRKVSVELPVDCSAFEIFDAFRAVMIGLTYSPDAFNDAILNYVDEHELLRDRYMTESNVQRNTIDTQAAVIRRLDEDLGKLRDPSGTFAMYIARTMLDRDGIVEASNEQWMGALLDASGAIRDALAAAEREVDNA